jgi:hypothetical protein
MAAERQVSSRDRDDRQQRDAGAAQRLAERLRFLQRVAPSRMPPTSPSGPPRGPNPKTAAMPRPSSKSKTPNRP